MSGWEDLITHVMSTTTKVELMAVFDMRGRPVAITEGLETSEVEGRALIACLKDTAKILTKLHVGDEDFICVPVINDTLIGTSVRNPSYVMVTQRDTDHIVMVVGQTTGRGSFIFELKQSLSLKAQGKLINQQTKPLLPVTGESDSVSTDRPDLLTDAQDVLVDVGQ